MGLPRTFVGFSSTDIDYYRTMQMWKANENIDFNFCNVQLPTALDSTNPDYIKRRCREQINQAGTYVLIIGQDTWTKTEYVQAEVEVAIEKGCRLIGANIDDWRFRNRWTCPAFFSDAGALFVPFSSRIIAAALAPWERSPLADWSRHDWYFLDAVYTTRGYVLDGPTATLSPPPPPAFMLQRRRL